MAVLIEVRISSESDCNLVIKASEDYLYFEVTFDLYTCIFRLALELISDIPLIQSLVFLIWLIEDLDILIIDTLQLLLIRWDLEVRLCRLNPCCWRHVGLDVDLLSTCVLR